jgi:hypothetical protein
MPGQEDWLEWGGSVPAVDAFSAALLQLYGVFQVK